MRIAFLLALLFIPAVAFAQPDGAPTDPSLILGGLLEAFKSGAWLKLAGYVAAIVLWLGDMIDPLKWMPTSLDKLMAGLLVAIGSFSGLALLGASVGDIIAAVGATGLAAFLHPPAAVLERFGRAPQA